MEDSLAQEYGIDVAEWNSIDPYCRILYEEMQGAVNCANATKNTATSEEVKIENAVEHCNLNMQQEEPQAGCSFTFNSQINVNGPDVNKQCSVIKHSRDLFPIQHNPEPQPECSSSNDSQPAVNLCNMNVSDAANARPVQAVHPLPRTGVEQHQVAPEEVMETDWDEIERFLERLVDGEM